MWNKFWTAAAVALAMGSSAALAETAGPSLHGFADISVKNSYVTPRGLVVTTEGATIQVLDGLVLDLPQDPSGWVTDVALVAGTWMDFNPGYDSTRNTKAFNEFDWFVGVNAAIRQDWKVGVQYVEFISPQDAFETEKNLEFSFAYDDSRHFKTFKIQPYVKVFYAISGDSTVVLGKQGDTFDVEIGAVPTWDLKGEGLPFTLSAPTWITVGPSEYWGGDQNAGVFSTGLKATYPLDLPPAVGRWSLYAGYQYYYLINDKLVEAETLLTGESDRSVHLFQMGVSLNF